MRIIKDENATTTYGYFKCSICGAQFYGGGPAIHDLEECKNTSYDNCNYFVGPRCKEWDTAETPVEPPNFDKWCYSKQIKGNWKEGLYHSLAAKFGGVDKIPQDENAWADEWNVLLKRIMAKAMLAG